MTQRGICTSLLLDVATVRSYSVVTLLRIYINEGNIKIEQHVFGPKSKNTIINSESMPFSVKLKAGTTIEHSMDCR